MYLQIISRYLYLNIIYRWTGRTWPTPTGGSNHCSQITGTTTSTAPRFISTYLHIIYISTYLLIYLSTLSIIYLNPIQVTPEGDWDDVICDKYLPYVCQKATRPDYIDYSVEWIWKHNYQSKISNSINFIMSGRIYKCYILNTEYLV